MKKLALFVSFLFLVATAAFATKSSQGTVEDARKAEDRCKKEGKMAKKISDDKAKTDKWECVAKEKAKSSDSDMDDSSTDNTDDSTETE